MSFDDPDQEPLKLYWPNNTRAQLPWPGTWITAYQSTRTRGVFLAGRERELEEVLHLLSRQLDQIASELPEGTEIGNVRSSLDAAARLALACVLLAVERPLAALNMAGSALLDLLHIGARVLHVVFAVRTHHRCSLRISRNEKQRATTGGVSA